jgi:hypothetical protein
MIFTYLIPPVTETPLKVSAMGKVPAFEYFQTNKGNHLLISVIWNVTPWSLVDYTASYPRKQ